MINKNEFVEIEFTAKVKDGEIFDTNIPEQAKKLGFKEQVKPLIISVGNNMVIKGLDNSIPNKEIGKDYSDEFSPENAFGNRDKNLVRMIPMRFFKEQNIYPQRGLTLSLDGMIARIISVSGGRVLVDFNNPLAGKIIIYNYKINKKVEDINEKINSLQDFLFKQRFEFSVKDKIITFKIPSQIEPILKLFEKQFNEILGMDIKTEITEEKKEKPEEKKKAGVKVSEQIEDKN
ncbi:MAG: FKBP-type peptidyl-prolyl cis-trans isomerase [Nanoarchaeota archaeon]